MYGIVVAFDIIGTGGSGLAETAGGGGGWLGDDETFATAADRDACSTSSAVVNAAVGVGMAMAARCCVELAALGATSASASGCSASVDAGDGGTLR